MPPDRLMLHAQEPPGICFVRHHSNFVIRISARYALHIDRDRTIFHVDMDAFFASVEQLDDPALRGLPVLVGGGGNRGVVTAASYEARVFGCRSAQPMAVARRLCPQAKIVPTRFARYREISQKMFAIFDQYSPLVEPLSIDEAFLDLTGISRSAGGAEETARRLKQQIKTELCLTASVGVAPNKFLAKLASDLQKPDGLVVIPTDQIESILGPLPVGKLWGIGPVTAEKLNRIGIHRIGDLRHRSGDDLQRLLGRDAQRLIRLANGQDDRPVVPDRQAKSIGQENTFGVDVTDRDEVRRALFEHVEHVGRRLRQHGLFARSVSLKIRYGEFETITRSTTFNEATCSTQELWTAAAALFDAWATGAFRPVRLIGMTAGQLSTGPGQLALFPDPKNERQKKVDTIADQITARFGSGAIRRGQGLK
jgi:DNA polymerase-4